jgi:hypothetical protein
METLNTNTKNENKETKLTQEQVVERIKAARSFALVFDEDIPLTATEFSISDATCRKLGFDALKADELRPAYHKEKDGVRQNGLFLVNNHCPKPETLEQAERVYAVLAKDANVLEKVQADIARLFQNKARVLLSAPVESASQQRRAVKLSKAETLKAAFAAGELTAEELVEKMTSLL